MIAALLIGLVLAGAPLGLAIGVGFCSRWLARRNGAPRYAALVGYAIACVAGTPIAWGLVKAVITAIGSRFESPGERRSVLAKVIAGVFYGDMLGSSVVLVGIVWLAFWAWRSRRMPTILRPKR